MSRRPRVPATPGKRTLYVLPEIRESDSLERKNALAARNACATEGVCPCGGAVGELLPNAELEGLYHYVFAHEAFCVALTDGDAA